MAQNKRPWEAIRQYSQENRVDVDISSDIATQIFDWFEAQSKTGAHEAGSFFESVYFFDAQFWKVSIPIVFGTVRLDALDSLDQMPETIKKEMVSDENHARNYVAFWADCVDYGFGLDDMKSVAGLDKFGKELLMSGDQELRAAVNILGHSRPRPRSILTSRMAVEIFFKAYIALKRGLTERQARSIGHDLNRGFDEFIEVSGYDDSEIVRDTLAVFPQIRERYESQDISPQTLWDGFSLAQSLGSIIVREFTDRNILEK